MMKIPFSFRPVALSVSLLCGAVTMPLSAGVLPPGANPLPADLIMDEPSYLGLAWGYTTYALGSTWGFFRNNVLSYVTPPSATSMAHKGAEHQDDSELMKLLNDAGYKLGEIDTDVGIIPYVSMKYKQIRENSEADWDYLEWRLEDSQYTNPGFYADLQRSIVQSVIDINSATPYQVSKLVFSPIPLPKVSFEVTPKESALSEEGSALMGAIQRVERSLYKMRRNEPLPPTASAKPIAATPGAVATAAAPPPSAGSSVTLTVAPAPQPPAPKYSRVSLPLDGGIRVDWVDCVNPIYLSKRANGDRVQPGVAAPGTVAGYDPIALVNRPRSGIPAGVSHRRPGRVPSLPRIRSSNRPP